MSQVMTRSRTTARTDASLPSIWRVGLSRGALELKQFFRERDSLIFTFLLPVAFMLLFGLIFGDQQIGGGFAYTQILLPAMLTMGIVSTSLVNIGVWIAIDRDNGTLRRLVSTPMPRTAYFLGKVVMMVFIGLAETVLILAVGALVYDVQMPQTWQKWLTLGWVGLLSFAVLGVLGVAISSLPRTSRSAAAVIQFPTLVLQFVSGIFIPFQQLPDWLQDASAFFPLKWIAQGFRSAFLPDDMAAAEPAGAWEYDRILLVLLAWLVGGLVVCATTFRWKKRGDG
ncbi:MAG TPA: ABC transporter permease [Actinopolymorphaceae bacterium]